MPHKSPEQDKEYHRAYKRSPRQRGLQKQYRQTNRGAIATFIRTYNAKLKLETLSYYGKGGKLQCCWPHCDVADVDMLTLDHINDDGGTGRRGREHGSGHKFYMWLKKNHYPEGFQTLCANHQAKKERERQRRASRSYHLWMDFLDSIGANKP